MSETARTVSFTQMKDGTKEDYELLAECEQPFVDATADRLLATMAAQEDETLEGYKISRLEHGLQSATRAYDDGADVDWIVSTLLHDIGDALAPYNHDAFAAAILRPFVREECTWVVEHHAAFQVYYYGHHYGWDRNRRERFKDNPYYQSCVDFCERWDQSSFDPDYPSKPLDVFAPMVREVFARKPNDPAVTCPGEVRGLPLLS